MDGFPYWDMVAVFHRYFQGPVSTFFLFKDNEHLPFVAMPFFYVDMNLFEAKGYSLIILTLLLNLLIYLIFHRNIARADLASGRLTVALSALFFISLFWLFHWKNLTWPKQIHMYLSAFFVVFALHLVSRRETSLPGEITWLPIAMISALMTLASFSFAYGMIGWIVLLFFAGAMRWPLKYIALIAVFFILNSVVYAYFYNYAAMQNHGNPIDYLGSPHLIAEYIVYYFASPLLALLKPVLPEKIALGISLPVSAAGCGFAIWGLAKMAFRGRSGRTDSDVFAYLVILFALGAAGMTALSRLRFGVEQGLAVRYAIMQVLFWLAIMLLVFRKSDGGAREKRDLSVFVVLALSLLFIPSQGYFERQSAESARRQWDATLALVNHADDRKMIEANIFPRMELAEYVSKNLAARGWSVYSQPQPWWIGRDISGLFAVSDRTACQGFLGRVDDLGRLQNAYHVSGWAYDVSAETPPEWVIIADAGGRIVGLGRSGLVREDVPQAKPEIHSSRTGWRGYIPADSPLESLKAYAVLSDGGTICELNRTRRSMAPETNAKP